MLKPNEHVKDMGGGWVVLSADFICAMVWPYGAPLRERKILENYIRKSAKKKAKK